jgi:hypothetical protein
MSAFVLKPNHINTLVTWASAQGIEIDGCSVKGHEQGFATTLHRQNVRSVNFRYGDNEPFDRIRFEPVAVTYHNPLVQIVSAANCYIYQTCETDDWESRIAIRLVCAIRDRALSLLGCLKQRIYDHPDYEGAEWAID